MAFRKNTGQQLTLDDSFGNLSPRIQNLIRNSWAHDFATIVFPAINEERFAVLYSDNKASRPSTPVNVTVGALMLKEYSNLSDDELLESILCDVRYQYALHTTSYEEQPVSDSKFMSDYLESQPEHAAEDKETVIVDGAYESYENNNLAEEKNITIVPTALSGKDPNKIFAEFELSDDETRVVKCPMGYEPVKQTQYKTGMIRAQFRKDQCENCPHRDSCKVGAYNLGKLFSYCQSARGSCAPNQAFA